MSADGAASVTGRYFLVEVAAPRKDGAESNCVTYHKLTGASGRSAAAAAEDCPDH